MSEAGDAGDAAPACVVVPFPHYINDGVSAIRRIKPGWYAIDKTGGLSFGPFSNREGCLRRISQFIRWSISFELRRRAL